jgi:hypothetical protein
LVVCSHQADGRAEQQQAVIAAQTAMTVHNRHKMMSNKFSPKSHPRQPMVYKIRLEGHLGRQWDTWFEGLTLTREENGDTLLIGPVTDQAALHGLLRKVRDLGLPLLEVTLVQPDQTDTTSDNT